MMALPSSCRGPLKTIMLAGLFLSCIVQLVQAQTRFFLTKVPQNPKVGQDVTLIPQGAPSQITLCQWFRESKTGTTGEILSYTQFEKNRQNSNGSAYTGRETLEQNCALRIRKLTRLDTGNYSVVIETIDQQSGEGNQSEVKILESYIYLQVNAVPQQIPISVEPKFPKSGQTITMNPQGTFREFTFCQWSVQNRSGHTTPIVNQIPGQKVQQVDSAYSGRATVGEACSLRIVNLKNSDTNNYTVTIRTPQKPSQQQPGHRNHSQGETEQEYTGHVYLNIAEQHTGSPKSSSASLSYSAGVIAGGLLGSLAWADALKSLFSVLLGSFASWRPKLFP